MMETLDLNGLIYEQIDGKDNSVKNYFSLKYNSGN